MNLFERVHMPSFAGATEWLNSEPLGPAELRGRVAVVNFWTWTCINWLRQEPYVRAWSQAYRDDGLVVIGIHTPEFSFEHELDGVRRATRERAIDYPVAIDNDYEIWSAFDNHFWPALYFRHLSVNHWALAGKWTIGGENVVLDRAGGSIAYRFHARDAHLVLSAGARGPIPFRVALDGKAPGRSHGVDVDEDGNGLLENGRMHQLVRQDDTVREHTLEITFLESGVEAYAFTFG